MNASRTPDSPPPSTAPRPRAGLVHGLLLIAAVVAVGLGLAAWKRQSLAEQAAAEAQLPDPMEAITVAVARERAHVRTTTAIGTVLALRSVTLENELPGKVSRVELVPGAIVEEGQLLVAFDVSVEEAELRAHEAQRALAETLLQRMERALDSRGASEVDVDRARAERDVTLAEIARTRAIIDRKTLRAPFRARVGLADVHIGQYLDSGTLLTTLQGVDEAVHVDFRVPQAVAAGLSVGDRVDVRTGGAAQPISAEVVAIDARVDRSTRSATVRARVEDVGAVPAPGSAVRVFVPVGERTAAVAVPVSALRRGPAGDHVFVIEPDDQGRDRAHLRPVKSGSVLGDEVVVREGLVLGERVAASGSFKLYEGVLVAVAAPGRDTEAVAR